MANEARQTSGKEKLHDHGEVADDEIEELEISQHGNFYDRITLLLENFASKRVGQLMIEKTDRVLKIVEDTTKWSLPQDNSDISLERPLPWIFFLILIVWFRIFRIWLSVGFYIIGLPPVTPHSMVYYIQTKRRYLRAIRVQGLKSIRQREIETTVMYSSNKNATFMEKFRKLFSSAICKPGQHREVATRCVFSRDGKTVEDMSVRSVKRSRDEDEVEVHNLTVSEMLDIYANEDSDDDSDYIPKEDENDDDISTSHSSSSNDDEPEKENQQETSNTQTVEAIKENGETKHISKSDALEQGLTKIHTTADSEKEKLHTNAENEQVHMPKEISDKNRPTELGQASEMPAATTLVAPQSAPNSPKTIANRFIFAEREENEKMSTPGHESAACFKPSSPTAATGSPQDIHSIFHPAPIVNGATGEAKSSTPKETDHHGRSSSETPEPTATNNQKKYFNYNTHNKHNHHHNVKNRSKNRH